MSNLEQFEKMLLGAKIEYVKTEGLDTDWSACHNAWWIRIMFGNFASVFTFSKATGDLLTMTINCKECYE